ncbi:AAA family ATPase, partial [Yersinia enterocolitica]|nr:AAA family ATPase [Yersinia enterocolitica]
GGAVRRCDQETALLNQINSKIKTLCVEKKHSQISDIQRDIKYWEEQLNSFPRGNAQHQNAKNQLKYQRESLNSLEKGVTLEFKDINEISALLDEKKLFLTTSKLIGKPQY